MWLLIVCTTWAMDLKCDYRAGVATALVTEAQCRATVENRMPGSLAWCVGPEGQMMVPKKQ